MCSTSETKRLAVDWPFEYPRPERVNVTHTHTHTRSSHRTDAKVDCIWVCRTQCMIFICRRDVESEAHDTQHAVGLCCIAVHLSCGLLVYDTWFLPVIGLATRSCHNVSDLWQIPTCACACTIFVCVPCVLARLVVPHRSSWPG